MKLLFIILFVFLSCSPESYAFELVGNQDGTNYQYNDSNKLNKVTFKRYGQKYMRNFSYDLNGNLLGAKTSWYSDTFENKYFSLTNYIAGTSLNAGSITKDATKIISGYSSSLGESSGVEEWAEFMYTDINKMQFEPNTNYTVTFDYKINKLTNNNSSFYFLARSPDGEHAVFDRSYTSWVYKVGQIENKSISFTTGDSSHYYLIWGIRNGGSISIDDIVITKTKESFETKEVDDTSYKIGNLNYPDIVTVEPRKIINGNCSVLGESPETVEWSEFIDTDLKKIQFEPNTSYKVNFNYKINRMSSNNGDFYFLARSLDGQHADFDKSLTSWVGEVGQVVNKTISFTTGKSSRYYLIWGIHKGGSISIDDIEISKVKESFESKTLDFTSYKIGSSIYPGMITNDQTKVIQGDFSSVGESPDTEVWSQFLETDLNKLKFEPNTTYKVSFSYKINKVSNNSGYFYFLARSLEGQHIDFDRSFTSWVGKVGEVVNKTISFTTGSSSHYYLIWGIYNGGSISIDDIVITN